MDINPLRTPPHCTLPFCINPSAAASPRGKAPRHSPEDSAGLAATHQARQFQACSGGWLCSAAFSAPSSSWGSPCCQRWRSEPWSYWSAGPCVRPNRCFDPKSCLQRSLGHLEVAPPDHCSWCCCWQSYQQPHPPEKILLFLETSHFWAWLKLIGIS